MKDFANLLGVEINEVFRLIPKEGEYFITNYDVKYKFTENGIRVKAEDTEWKFDIHALITIELMLITPEMFEIKKDRRYKK